MTAGVFHNEVTPILSFKSITFSKMAISSSVSFKNNGFMLNDRKAHTSMILIHKQENQLNIATHAKYSSMYSIFDIVNSNTLRRLF